MDLTSSAHYLYNYINKWLFSYCCRVQVVIWVDAWVFISVFVTSGGKHYTRESFWDECRRVLHCPTIGGLPCYPNQPTQRAWPDKWTWVSGCQKGSALRFQSVPDPVEWLTARERTNCTKRVLFYFLDWAAGDHGTGCGREVYQHCHDTSNRCFQCRQVKPCSLLEENTYIKHQKKQSNCGPQGANASDNFSAAQILRVWCRIVRQTEMSVWRTWMTSRCCSSNLDHNYE